MNPLHPNLKIHQLQSTRCTVIVCLCAWLCVNLLTAIKQADRYRARPGSDSNLANVHEVTTWRPVAGFHRWYTSLLHTHVETLPFCERCQVFSWKFGHPCICRAENFNSFFKAGIGLEEVVHSQSVSQVVEMPVRRMGRTYTCVTIEAVCSLITTIRCV